MAVGRFAIIDSTLREGEQFALAHFDSAQRLVIARALDDFGVEYVELTSPVASPQSFADAKRIARLGLRARVLAHVRCALPDVEAAVATGVQGVNVLLGTSAWLRRYSHGRDLDQIIAQAEEVLRYLRPFNLEVRFSAEDAFRSDVDDLLRVYRTVDRLGVARVGLADTVGIATPRQVAEVVAAVRRVVTCDIEFHGHNDSGCAIANAHAALEAGATHVDTTVLGIGERNGITPLGGLIARLYADDPALVRKYRLAELARLDRLVAEITGVPIPFTNCITGPTALSHKAGIHTNAVLRHPSSYEIFDPAEFGVSRHILVGHRLTGRHAVAHRAQELGLSLGETTLRAATAEIKRRADSGPLAPDQVDDLLRAFSTEPSAVGSQQLTA